jgi:hypothetical protein
VRIDDANISLIARIYAALGDKDQAIFGWKNLFLTASRDQNGLKFILSLTSCATTCDFKIYCGACLAPAAGRNASVTFS